MSETASAPVTSQEERRDSRAVLKEHVANELFFAVVGPVGAGCTRAAETLKKALEAAEDSDGRTYECTIIKASALIRNWANKTGAALPSDPEDGWKTLSYQREMQNLGDEMRKGDHAALGSAAIREIAKQRAGMMNTSYTPGKAVEPDGRPRAFIVDSFKHPAEAMLFRRVYGEAFALVGTVCSEPVRKTRILKKFFPEVRWKEKKIQKEVDVFMERDGSDEGKPYGQHVTDIFHEADYFVDNSNDDAENKEELLNEPLGRLIDIISHKRIHRPTISETAMQTAASAKLRSACLSRQVGAALVDVEGNVVSTGTNEAPKAGGGVYGEHFSANESDFRCAFHKAGIFCRNNEEQNKIIADLLDRFPQLKSNEAERKDLETLRKTRLGGLLEFSRAVHAEMDAILSAARAGISPVGSRLFVTTFPCHYCARHIVSAGIYEVQFIEPYPKSLALELHDDAIEADPDKWSPPQHTDMRTEVIRDRKQGADGQRATNGDDMPGKVLFRPFVGVAPRLYPRAFLKDREYKDKVTGEFQMGEPLWGGSWSLPRVSYPELEARLAKPDTSAAGDKHA